MALNTAWSGYHGLDFEAGADPVAAPVVTGDDAGRLLPVLPGPFGEPATPVATPNRSDGVGNHLSRSGKDDGAERRCVRRLGILPWDQVW